MFSGDRKIPARGPTVPVAFSQMGENSGHPNLVCKKLPFRYLDDILNINNVYFDNMVSQIYPAVLELSASFVDPFCYLCFVFVCHTVLSVPSNIFGKGL